MPSYQDRARTRTDERWLTFTAAVQVSTTVRDRLAARLAARRARLGTRWRLLDVSTQATLVIGFARTNLTYAELAAGHNISPATCWRNINEGIGLLADAAIRLKDVVRLARKAGWDYLTVDGVNVPTVAFARKIHRRQKHYSGKHKRHGVNVQTICAPDGRLLWASAALPGKTNDITAARRHKLDAKVAALIGLLADLGYLGLPNTITGYKRKRGQKQLPAGQQAANTVHAGLRSIGERGNAQLKWWRVMATELRCRPNRCTRLVKAVLTLHHWETTPFAA
jgi:hypothetical protein